MESYFENDLKIELRKYVESEPANEKDENYDKMLSNIRKYFLELAIGSLRSIGYDLRNDACSFDLAEAGTWERN